jgi:SpoVK/Ycf46/Vps4 family AAA+-type ATPase
MDLSGVLVFFDEMDALVQTRNGGAHLDVFSQFLTTTMLPKLTRLHDGARVIFIMATNYQDRFDAAIKRSGRFDLLLCMGPPKLQEKLDRLHVIYKLDKATDNTTKAGRLIDEFLKPDQGLVDQFALLTFGELKEFMKGISKSDTTILSDLTDFGSEKFRNRLAEYSEYVTLRMKELEELQKLLRKSKLEDLLGEKFSLADLGNNFNINQTVRYLLDRRQSRVQY